MLNRITVMGRLTRDPELRKTGNDTSVVSFTVACDRDRAAKGEEKVTDFIDCVAWRGTADFISKYFEKGSMICVSGRLQLRDWTDKEGNKRRSAEVLADSVYFCGKKSDGESHGSNGDENYGSTPSGGFKELNDEDDGELPF